MRYVGRCLDSLQAQSVGVSPVVVVDNGSTDGSREWIQQHYDGVEVLENPTNLGVAAGYNRAISACADASYILILNTDVFLEPDFIARALHALTASPDLGAVTGRLFQEGTGELISGGFFLRPQIRITYRELTDEACEVFGATGAAVLYRRDVLEDLKVGPVLRRRLLRLRRGYRPGVAYPDPGLEGPLRTVGQGLSRGVWFTGGSAPFPGQARALSTAHAEESLSHRCEERLAWNRAAAVAVAVGQRASAVALSAFKDAAARSLPDDGAGRSCAPVAVGPAQAAADPAPAPRASRPHTPVSAVVLRGR